MNHWCRRFRRAIPPARGGRGSPRARCAGGRPCRARSPGRLRAAGHASAGRTAPRRAGPRVRSSRWRVSPWGVGGDDQRSRPGPAPWAACGWGRAHAGGGIGLDAAVAQQPAVPAAAGGQAPLQAGGGQAAAVLCGDEGADAGGIERFGCGALPGRPFAQGGEVAAVGVQGVCGGTALDFQVGEERRHRRQQRFLVLPPGTAVSHRSAAGRKVSPIMQEQCHAGVEAVGAGYPPPPGSRLQRQQGASSLSTRAPYSTACFRCRRSHRGSLPEAVDERLQEAVIAVDHLQPFGSSVPGTGLNRTTRTKSPAKSSASAAAMARTVPAAVVWRISERVAGGAHGRALVLLGRWRTGSQAPREFAVLVAQHLQLVAGQGSRRPVVARDHQAQRQVRELLQELRVPAQPGGDFMGAGLVHGLTHPIHSPSKTNAAGPAMVTGWPGPGHAMCRVPPGSSTSTRGWCGPAHQHHRGGARAVPRRRGFAHAALIRAAARGRCPALGEADVGRVGKAPLRCGAGPSCPRAPSTSSASITVRLPIETAPNSTACRPAGRVGVGARRSRTADAAGSVRHPSTTCSLPSSSTSPHATRRTPTLKPGPGSAIAQQPRGHAAGRCCTGARAGRRRSDPVTAHGLGDRGRLMVRIWSQPTPVRRSARRGTAPATAGPVAVSTTKSLPAPCIFVNRMPGPGAARRSSHSSSPVGTGSGVHCPRPARRPDPRRAHLFRACRPFFERSRVPRSLPVATGGGGMNRSALLPQAASRKALSVRGSGKRRVSCRQCSGSRSATEWGCSRPQAFPPGVPPEPERGPHHPVAVEAIHARGEHEHDHRGRTMVPMASTLERRVMAPLLPVVDHGPEVGCASSRRAAGEPRMAARAASRMNGTVAARQDPRDPEARAEVGQQPRGPAEAEGAFIRPMYPSRRAPRRGLMSRNARKTAPTGRRAGRGGTRTSPTVPRGREAAGLAAVAGVHVGAEDDRYSPVLRCAAA